MAGGTPHGRKRVWPPAHLGVGEAGSPRLHRQGGMWSRHSTSSVRILKLDWQGLTVHRSVAALLKRCVPLPWRYLRQGGVTPRGDDLTASPSTLIASDSMQERM